MHQVGLQIHGYPKICATLAKFLAFSYTQPLLFAPPSVGGSKLRKFVAKTKFWTTDQKTMRFLYEDDIFSILTPEYAS